VDGPAPGPHRHPAFREAGFRTYALWRNNWISPSFGFSQGFEVYHSPRPRPIPPSLHREKPTIARGGSDQDIVFSAREFLRTHRNERWFLYLHLMDVHQYVYDQDTALFGTTYSDIYDNSIRWVDRVVGSLLDDLDGHGLRDRTVVVVAADHGEAFGEHGREGHARDVYGEVVTTPFILSLPFRLDTSVVVETPTENVDVWPTLLELLGLPALEDVDGRSRVPEIQLAAERNQNGSEPNARYAHIDQTWARQGEDPRPMVAVTDGPYRLVYRAGRAAELYDQSVDPGEQRNVGAEQPEVLARMTQMAEDYLAQPAAEWGAAPAVDLSPSQLEELRALGYVVE
jgi:arylsulfatase A-like enzyme